MAPCLIQVTERVQGEIEVSFQDSFACVGEGGAAAQTSLLFRDHDRFDDLTKTAYEVFEAKTMAEVISTVGLSSTIYLQLPNQPLRYLTGKGFKRCNILFKEFSPKKIQRKLLKENALELEVFAEDKVRTRFSKGKPGLLPSSQEPKRLDVRT